MSKWDNNTVAIFSLVVIVCLAIALQIEGAKDIANVAIGGLVGFMSGKNSVSNNT